MVIAAKPVPRKMLADDEIIEQVTFTDNKIRADGKKVNVQLIKT